MARKIDTRKTRETFVIITNGKKSEHNYFNLLKSYKSIYEVKDKLKSSLERLLNITETLLIKSINKDHLKELSIKCKEIQKNKFGPWSYQQ